SVSSGDCPRRWAICWTKSSAMVSGGGRERLGLELDAVGGRVEGSAASGAGYDAARLVAWDERAEPGDGDGVAAHEPFANGFGEGAANVVEGGVGHGGRGGSAGGYEKGRVATTARGGRRGAWRAGGGSRATARRVRRGARLGGARRSRPRS